MPHFIEEETETREGSALLTYSVSGRSWVQHSVHQVSLSPFPGQVELKRKRSLPGPGGDTPQALAGGWKYSPAGDLPDIKASFQTTVLESAERASEQVALLLRSFPIM